MCVYVRLALVMLAFASAVAAQTPQPFPRPNTQQPPPKPAPATPVPPSGAGTGPQPAPRATPADPKAPTEETLGFVIYPGAQFIASYDAGRGQRYHLFGSAAPFAELVTYYRTVLKERGNLVFEEPPTHMFEIGRFRSDVMAFPPGVTIKDYTWGGSKGYPNPRRPPNPERFPTVIMIVPEPRVPAQ